MQNASLKTPDKHTALSSLRTLRQIKGARDSYILAHTEHWDIHSSGRLVDWVCKLLLFFLDYVGVIRIGIHLSS